MDRYVPLSKKSKKEQKKFYALQRNTWNGMNPVTRTVPNGKAYNRKRQKQQDFRDENTCCFCVGLYMIMIVKVMEVTIMRKNNYKVILRLTKA